MDTALALLLNLFALTTPLAEPESGVSALEIDAPAILAEVAPPQAVAAFAQLLADAAAQRAPAVDLLPRLHELAAMISPVAGHEQRLAELASQTQTLAGVARAGGEGALTHVTIDLATSPLAPLVTAWHVPAADGASRMSVVYLAAIARADRVVRPRGDHFVERHVRLRYDQDQPYPLIELDAPSAHAIDAAPVVRSEWRQHPLSDYDLRIFSEQERLMGSVRTRLVESPSSVEGAGLKLQLGAPPGVRLLSTELLDQHEHPLLRVLRWPAIPGD